MEMFYTYSINQACFLKSNVLRSATKNVAVWTAPVSQNVSQVPFPRIFHSSSPSAHPPSNQRFMATDPTQFSMSRDGEEEIPHRIYF